MFCKQIPLCLFSVILGIVALSTLSISYTSSTQTKALFTVNGSISNIHIFSTWEAMRNYLDIGYGILDMGSYSMWFVDKADGTMKLNGIAEAPTHTYLHN